MSYKEVSSKMKYTKHKKSFFTVILPQYTDFIKRNKLITILFGHKQQKESALTNGFLK
jgi:hypothetical protein